MQKNKLYYIISSGKIPADVFFGLTEITKAVRGKNFLIFKLIFTEIFFMDVKQQTVNAIRVLAAEEIEKANSGHPGIALGSAPLIYELFADFLKFNPQNSAFDDRDRFVLSAGHGSAMLYATLYLFGYGLTKNDLMNFRQFGSRTPGHPERGVTPGVEISTGPLGQGIANAVGMAIAETKMAARFNREGYEIFNHYTYALCGDGCMQEGIENEAASLAGTLKLNKLIVLYDKNNITIEGNTDLAFSEDVAARHKALGWNVINVADGNDLNALKKAITKAKKSQDKPTLIVCHTKIGYGSPLAGSEKTHGSPLGKENLAKLKENLEWTSEPFEVPAEVKTQLNRVINKGKRTERAWRKMLKKYEGDYPELAKELRERMQGKIPEDVNSIKIEFEKADAGRGYGSTVLNAISAKMPSLIGGSADLAPSNKSVMKNSEYYSAENRNGSNFHFGIREHAMAAICNGMAAHGGVVPYCATFFVFTDYMKNAMRLSALMNLRVIYILTHDSIGVGEDGPTHEPVEQLISLRSIPGFNVYRPADGNETLSAWLRALNTNGPSAIVLSRQTLPLIPSNIDGAGKGAYVLAHSEKKSSPDCLLVATGSEVSLCVKAQQMLAEKGISARVISAPCLEIFEKQSANYKESVMPSKVKARVFVEAGTPHSWYKYANDASEMICISEFGASAPAEKLFEHYGFTAENVCEKAMSSINKVRNS